LNLKYLKGLTAISKESISEKIGFFLQNGRAKNIVGNHDQCVRAALERLASSSTLTPV
jgi:hypothetical protein